MTQKKKRKRKIYHVWGEGKYLRKRQKQFPTIAYRSHSCSSMSFSSGFPNCSAFTPPPWDSPSLGQTVLAGGGSPQYICSDLTWPPSHSCSDIAGNRKCSVAGYSQISDSTGEWDIATLVSWGRHKSQCRTISKKQPLGKITGNGYMPVKVYFSRLRRRLPFSWNNFREYTGKRADLQLSQVKEEVKNPRIDTISKG